MTSGMKLCMWILAAAAWVVCTADSQAVPSCASDLVPCFGSMNVTNPPESCCKPLKQTIDTQLQCLCNLYNTPGLLPSLGVNVSEALTLPVRCGISGDLSACGTAQSPRSSTAPPSGVPGTDKNGGEEVASAGILGLVVFWTSIILY